MLKIVVFLSVCCTLSGCSGGAAGTGSTSSPSGASNQVTLAETIVVGDAIPNNWPWVQSDFGVFVPCDGSGGQIDTFSSCYQANFVSICDSGCQPGGFQQAVPGKKRAVLFVGTEDALLICGGEQEYPTGGLSESVKAIQVLYQMQVWLATIPPIIDKNGDPICTAAVNAVNQEIEATGKNSGSTVVDLGGAMTVLADYELKDKVSDSFGNSYYLPSTTGYAAMQSVYTEAIQ